MSTLQPESATASPAGGMFSVQRRWYIAICAVLIVGVLVAGMSVWFTLTRQRDRERPLLPSAQPTVAYPTEMMRPLVPPSPIPDLAALPVQRPLRVADAAPETPPLCYVQGQSYSEGYRLVTRNAHGTIESEAECARDDATDTLRWRYRETPAERAANNAAVELVRQRAPQPDKAAGPSPDPAEPRG